MPRLPFIKFFPNDWISDPRLAKCSPSARGIWIDLLCAIHVENSGGSISGTREQLSQLARCPNPQALVDCIDELSSFGVAEITLRNDTYTIVSRRLAREFRSRKLSKDRQSRKRHGPVTTLSRSCHGVYSRSHISEPPLPPARGGPPVIDSEFDRIKRHYADLCAEHAGTKLDRLDLAMRHFHQHNPGPDPSTTALMIRCADWHAEDRAEPRFMKRFDEFLRSIFPAWLMVQEPNDQIQSPPNTNESLYS